jgi:CelD/BcsL family acetyltransferase involved in cellulose biosynthesis
MATAAAIDSRIERVAPISRAARIARVEIFQTFDAAAGAWHSLDGADRIATPYQRFDFLNAWQRHVGEYLALKPRIVVAYDDAGAPVALLPLVIEHAYGLSVACFPGGKHVTFNMPIWRRDFADHATAETMQSLVHMIAAADPTIDALALMRQPQSWNGLPNPLALLGGQASVNECPLLVIDPRAGPSSRISNSFRRRLNHKERKLKANSGFRYTIAQTADDARRLLDAFFAVKPVRLAQQGLPNVFAEPGNEPFLREVAEIGLGTKRPSLEIHALECDDEVITVFAGVADDKRFSMMFNTYTLSANSRYSPGLILIRNIVDHYASRGFTSLDLGIGADDYKLLFCKHREPVLDSFIALSTRGRVLSLWLSLEAYGKRFVKRSHHLTRMALWLRRMLRQT